MSTGYIVEQHLFIDLEPSQVPQAVFSHVKMIRDRSSYKRRSIINAFHAYDQNDSLLNFAELHGITDKILPERVIKLNVFKNIVDTMHSKIAKSRVRVTFLPTNASYEAREQAKARTLAIDSLFDMINYHEVKQRSFKDTLICGTGITKLIKDPISGLVKAERVFPLEIFVDELDSLYGNPTFIYHVKIYPKRTVAEMFGVDESELGGAETWAVDLIARHGLSNQSFNSAAMRNTCAVVEAFHKALGNKTGRHVICTSNKLLYDEEWPHDFLPFSFDRYSDTTLGFWANGIWDEIRGLQLEIDQIINKIKESIDVGSAFKVAIEEGSEIKKQAFTNEIGQIITYRGTPPAFIAPQTVNEEVYMYLQSLIEKCYQVVGVSQLSAQSQKPAGLNAAVALREYQDIESERFHVLAQRREASIVSEAKKLLKLYAAWSDSEKIKIPITNRNGVAQYLSTKDLLSDIDSFIIRPFPTSLLPQTPQGRLQTVTELFQNGLLTTEQFWDLLDVPDTERLLARSASTVKLVSQQLEIMMRKKEYQAPDPFYQIDEAIRVAMSFYLDAKYNGFDEGRLELIRQYIAQLQTYSQYVQQGEQMLVQAQQAIEQANAVIQQAQQAQQAQ